MAKQKPTPTSPEQAFMHMSRMLRWLAIVVILITFPFDLPQTKYTYVLVAAITLYNTASYLRFSWAKAVFNSAPIAIVIDSIFVSILLALTGTVNTPYCALLAFNIMGAAYLYRLRGAIAVFFLQSVMLVAVSAYSPWDEVEFSEARLITILLFMLLALGAWVEKLSRNGQQERTTLLTLQQQGNNERQRLTALVNSLSDAIFVVSDQGKIIEYNEAAHILTGSSDDIHTKSFAKTVVLRPRTNHSATPVDILKENSSAQHRRDLQILLEDGSTIDLDISVTPVHSAEGQAVEYIFVCEDITKERSLDEQRSAFISVASHELRTPLAILEGSLETVLLSKDPLPAGTKSLIEQSHRNARYLAGIVKDITMLSEAQNDNLPIQLTRLSADAILKDLVKDFEDQARQKNLHIVTTVDKDTPPVLSTERYVHEILQNFLTNALKYSDKGTVTLSAQPAKNGGAVFAVTDEGMGISPKDQKMLFTKFFRAEDFRIRSTGGTGLGLYLCMEIAQRMGARLWCKSTLGKGSTFFLEIPPYSKLQGDQNEVVKAQVANLVDDI